jgi:hypothetical protein
VHPAHAATEQPEAVNVPESVPLLQVRVWLLQLPPHGTELAAKAVILDPWEIVPPHGRVHAAQGTAEQD